MSALLGIILHSIGGIAAASFYTPFKNVKGWAWENYWLVSGIASWIIMPWVLGWLTVPELGSVLFSYSSTTLFWTFLFGILWGIGGLTFGLSMRYLGLSLGYALALGFSAAFGTIIPPLFEGTFLQLLSTTSGILVMSGVVICLLGILVCGKAGLRKEKELSKEAKQNSITEFDLKKGITVAIVSGILSACMAFGLAAGKPLGQVAISYGTHPLWQNTVILIVVLLGGFCTNFVWCLVLNVKNRTSGQYFAKSSFPLRRNYLFASLAGVIWYLQFMFYGMGSTQMGRFDFASWTLHMAFIIVFSNLWGFYFREWEGVSTTTKRIIYTGLSMIILSTAIIGLSAYLSDL
jgi:L-rhamnose-H+ transport protein